MKKNMFFLVSTQLYRAALVLFLSLLAGCGGSTMLLNRETVASIPSSPSAQHRIIYFAKTFTYTPEGKLMEKTHKVVRVGENGSAFPSLVYVFDNSLNKLLNFEARVIHRNGDVENRSASDLTSFNLSSAQMIAEQYVKAAYIKERMTTGDLVETASLHELTLVPLGINFSLSELEYAAENITCTVELPRRDSLRFKIVNDTARAIARDSAATKLITFRWPSYTPPSQQRREMEKKNQSPHLYAARTTETWESFGDWYMSLADPKLQPGSEIVKTARAVTAGKNTPKEKLDAIFEYCQRNVRYEQVYLPQGEIIPNSVEMILARKYGDCKDYSAIMHAMARSINVQTQLALCYRGRGKEFFDDMPVSQFNHCILHYEENGRDYWYDGTNRVGLSGITTFDLANARALVLEKGKSRLVTIAESPKNNLSVTGTMFARGSNSLAGDLTVTFSDQYAIEFFWLDYQANDEKMTTYLSQALKNTLNENIILQNLSWKAEKDRFIITATCEMPNCVTNLQSYSYISLARVLPELLPKEIDEKQRRDAFYFPYYNAVSVDLHLGNFVSADEKSSTEKKPQLQLQYQLPSGPFTDANRKDFLSRLSSVIERYVTTFKSKSL